MQESYCPKEKLKKALYYLTFQVFLFMSAKDSSNNLKKPTLYLPKRDRNETHAGMHCRTSKRLLLIYVLEY